jgi:hypothetical protein
VRAWCLSETRTARSSFARAAFSSTVRLAKSTPLICDGHFAWSAVNARTCFSLILRFRVLEPACSLRAMPMLAVAGCDDARKDVFRDSVPKGTFLTTSSNVHETSRRERPLRTVSPPPEKNGPPQGRKGLGGDGEVARPAGKKEVGGSVKLPRAGPK